MFRLPSLGFGTLLRLFCPRRSLLLENLALRQQVVVLKRRHRRQKLDLCDKLFWLLVRRCWSGKDQLLAEEELLGGQIPPRQKAKSDKFQGIEQ